MIELRHITIHFQRPIIIDETLRIFPKEITVISGDSGSGKTSLLNILGLLDTQSQYQYYWNNQEIKAYSSLRRNTVSYVFQDYNVIDDLSIKDNFRVMFYIANQKYDADKVHSLLDLVSLSYHQLNQKSKSLSGGEKQRLALALALVKEPQLLLLDEPTANLDEDNAHKVVEILHKIKQREVMIVIASHRPDIYQADHLYQIQNCHLVEKVKEHHEIVDRQEKVIKRFPIFSYTLTHMKNHMIIYCILTFMISFALTQVLSIFVENRYAVQWAQEAVDMMSSKDIMVQDITLSLGEDLDSYYQANYHNIDDNVLQSFQNIDHVQNIYPYFSINYMSGPRCTVENGKMIPDHKDYEDETRYSQIEYQNKVYSLEEGSVLTFTVCDENNKKNVCYLVDQDVQSGVFLSRDIAMLLGITELNHTKITLMVPTVMGYHPSEGQIGYPDGTFSSKYTNYPLTYYYQEMSVEVQGIFETAENETLFDYGFSYEISMDHSFFEKLYHEAVHDPQIKKAYDEYIDFALLNPEEFHYGFYSSTYCVQVDNPKNVQAVEQDIKDLHKPIYVKTTDTMRNLMIDNYRSYVDQMSFIPFIIAVLSIIIVCLMFTFTLYGRRKELSFLTAHGVPKTKVFPLFDFMSTCLLALIFSQLGLLYHFSQPYTLNYTFSYMIESLLVGIVILVVLCLLCGFVTYVFYKKLDVIKELRSK